MSVTIVLLGLLGAVATTLGAVAWARLRILGAALRLARIEGRALARQTQFFRKVTEHASEGMTVLEMNGTLIWANPAYCRMMRRDLHDMVGRHPQSFALRPEDTPSVETISRFRFDPQDPAQTGATLFLNVRGDGTAFWNQLNTAFFVNDAGQWLAALICRDITEQITRENALRDAGVRLEYAASHDSLTGLANRAALLAFAAQALSQRLNGRLGILHLDLDRFKEVNDTHGHSAGDAVLTHVAAALRGALRDGDMAARLGGDEFVVACPDLQTLDDLRLICDRIVAAISAPVLWQGRSLTCTVSIGADLAPTGETDIDDLFYRSDFALYEAKRAGRAQIAAYDEAVHQRHVEAQELAADLARAIETGDMGFAFQPILDLSVGQIVTLETLVRWNHPTRGPLSPGQFLPLAEKLGMMADLDFLAMKAALDLKARLNARAPTGLTITLNASAALLAHPDFTLRLAQGMVARGLSPPEIGIEVLETVVFDAPGSADPASAVITTLRAAGHPVMLDDFGVGYAGLAHLAQLDVSGIKIDLSLVQAAKTDPTSVRILETMIELCARLGLTSIAEGVDTVWMATRLQDMGCSRLQGWWLSPALPADDIDVWLQGYLLPPPIAPDEAASYFLPEHGAEAGQDDGKLSIRLSHGPGLQGLSGRKKGL